MILMSNDAKFSVQGIRKKNSFQSKGTSSTTCQSVEYCLSDFYRFFVNLVYFLQLCKQVLLSSDFFICRFILLSNNSFLVFIKKPHIAKKKANFAGAEKP